MTSQYYAHKYNFLFIYMRNKRGKQSKQQTPIDTNSREKKMGKDSLQSVNGRKNMNFLV